MRSSKTTRTAGVLVATTAWVVVIVWAWAGTAGAGLGDGLLPPATTTTIADPVGPLDDLVDLPVEETTTTTSTTTTTAPPTTTTEPADDGTVTSGGGGASADTETSRGGDVLPPATGSKPVIPAPPIAPAAGGAAATVGTHVDSAVGRTPAAAAPVPKSVVVTSTAAAPSIAVPFAARSTAPILGRLAGLDLTPAALARLLAPFPVAGEATYASDFGAPRHVPQPHPHEGTDIFAARGTPVIASADGTVTHLTRDTQVAGTSLRLTAAGGTYFYYAHLDRLAAGLRENDVVTKGDVLGFVGTSGNAEGTAPHLHYEIHPNGGGPVDPVPYLDRWLADAARSAESVEGVPTLSLRSGTKATPRPLTRQAAPTAATDLGDVQPIASSGVAPAVVMFLMTAAVLVVRRLRGRTRPHGR